MGKDKATKRKKGTAEKLLQRTGRGLDAAADGFNALRELGAAADRALGLSDDAGDVVDVVAEPRRPS